MNTAINDLKVYGMSLILQLSGIYLAIYYGGWQLALGLAFWIYGNNIQQSHDIRGRTLKVSQHLVDALKTTNQRIDMQTEVIGQLAGRIIVNNEGNGENNGQ